MLSSKSYSKSQVNNSSKINKSDTNKSDNTKSDNTKSHSFYPSENNVFNMGSNSEIYNNAILNNNKQIKEYNSDNNFEEDNPIINNLKFSNINFAQPDPQPTTHNLNLIDTNPVLGGYNNMFVTFSDNRFKLFNETKQHVGEFSVDHIMKYISETHDHKKQFMKHLSEQEYKDAKHIIKNFVCDTEYDNRIKYTNINIKNHTQSPFMGDLEMIINLNNLVGIFEQNKLNKELDYVDPQNRGKIEQLIKRFNYTMLNYTMGVVDLVNDQIKGDSTKEALKKQLMMYSVNTVSKISGFVQNQLNTVVKNNEKLEKMMFTSIKLKSIINDKLDKLSNKLDIQQVIPKPQIPVPFPVPPQQTGGQDNFKEITLSSLESNPPSPRYSPSSESSIELTHSVDSNFEYNYSDDDTCRGSINSIS